MSRELKITQLDQIPPASTDWVWDQRIPEGELTLLAGREGGGKSTIAYELAAQLSRGDLAGDFYYQPSGTIIVATEDALDRTIVPRLMAATADLSQVVQVTVHDPEEGYTDEVTLPIDLALLRDASRTATFGWSSLIRCCHAWIFDWTRTRMPRSGRRLSHWWS